MSFGQSVIISAAVLATVAGAAAQQADGAAGQVPVIRAETRLLLLDAVVTDKKGNYIADLTAKDFRVWEDDKEQAVVNCSFEGENPQAAEAHKRYLIFVFDDSRLQPADVGRARRAATQFMDANAGPNRLMAVASYNTSMRLRQNFTSDSQKLKAALSGAETGGGAAVGLHSREVTAASQILSDKAGVRDLLLSLGALAKSLGALPGRKIMVLLSPGFEVDRDSRSAELAISDLCNRANVSIYPIDVGASTMQATVTPAADTMNNRVSDRALPGVDQEPERTAGPRATGAAPARLRQVLESFAQGTGGFVESDSKDLFASIDKIGSEQDKYYVLSYAAPVSQPGSCHALKVKVARSGTVVRARSAYCNAPSKDALAGTPVAQRLEAVLAGPGPGNSAGSLKAPFFYTAENTARVDVALDIPAADIAFTKGKGEMKAAVQVLGVAYRPDGAVAARFSDAVNLDLDQKQHAAFQLKPFHYESQFEMGAGDYKLKVAFSPGPDKIGKLEALLAIEAYDGKHFVLSGLALSNDLHRADQGSGAVLAQDRTPLVAQGMLLIPSGTNRFRQTDSAALYAEAYDPFKKETPALDVGVVLKITDRASGKEKDNSGLIKVSGAAPSEDATVKLGLALPLKKLGPGAYRVELTGYDSAGNQAPARTADFDVE